MRSFDQLKWLLSTGLLSLVLGAAAGCATTPTGEAAIPVSRLDAAPTLNGCSQYQDPVLPSNVGATSVLLTFVVDETGTVAPGTIQVQTRRGLKPVGDDLVSRAKSDVLSCSFTPGLLDGEPVRTRMERRFRYPGGA
ncbi:MAG TPA: hypothetical protein VMM12_11855 [Longimicrobiales bacterium]|nr:hypothetical protein [Longimicrobiales bacterium]